jgi:acyl-CoA synthetase (NDP forming)
MFYIDYTYIFMLLLERLTNPKKIALIGNINDEDTGTIISRNIRSSSVKRSVFRIIDPEISSTQTTGASVTNFPANVDIAVISSTDPNVKKHLEACSRNNVPFVFLLTSASGKTGSPTYAEDYSPHVPGSAGSCKIFGPDSTGICDSSTDLNLTVLEYNVSDYAQNKPFALLAVDCNRHALVRDEFRKFRSDIGFLLDFGKSYGDTDIFTGISSYLDNRREISALALLISQNGCMKSDVPAILRSNFDRPVIVYRERRELKANNLVDKRKKRGKMRKSLPTDDCIEAKDLYDVTDFARVIALNPAMRGINVSVISTKSGTESVAQDYLKSRAFGMQLDVPHLGMSTKTKLTSLLGKGYASHNPVTLGPKEKEKIGYAIETLMSDRNTDAVLTLVSPDSYDLINYFVSEADPGKMKKPIVVALIGTGSDYRALKELSGSKIAVYPSIRRAITALKALAAYSLERQSLVKTIQQV